VTAVHQEGRLEGPDIDLVVAAKAATRHPVLASGGIGSIADLRAVARAGAAATVIGMALYVGALDARAVAKEFAQ
jgi:phosphoribosylformimino-5-aminoimidazole carboxamide ribotide isomerase